MRSQQLRALAYEGAARRYGDHRPHHPRPAGARARHHRDEGLRRLFPGGQGHRRARPHPLRPRLGRQFDRVLLVSASPTWSRWRAGLLFERFLNPERKDPPDIDLDFPWDERDHILAWVFRRYPHPRAAMVANHNTFKLRGALREVAKVDGRPAARNPRGHPADPLVQRGQPIDQLLAEHPNFTGLDLPAAWQELARGRSRWSARRGTCRCIRAAW